MFLLVFDFEHAYIKKWHYAKVVFINECQSCEISNQMFFNAIFSFFKSATGFLIFLLFKKGTKLSGYHKQNIFAFKVCADIVVTLRVWLLPGNFKWL